MYLSVNWLHFILKGGGGGVSQPLAPLRSDAKVPSWSSLCDMNDTNMQSMLYIYYYYFFFFVVINTDLSQQQPLK